MVQKHGENVKTWSKPGTDAISDFRFAICDGFQDLLCNLLALSATTKLVIGGGITAYGVVPIGCVISILKRTCHSTNVWFPMV
jgi:hypothetical protein